jgi:hypothetical protein
VPCLPPTHGTPLLAQIPTNAGQANPGAGGGRIIRDNFWNGEEWNGCDRGRGRFGTYCYHRASLFGTADGETVPTGLGLKIKGRPEPEGKRRCFERFHHAWKYGIIMVQPSEMPEQPDQTTDGSGGGLPRHEWKTKGKRKWKMEMEVEAGSWTSGTVRYVPPFPSTPPLQR